MTFEILNQDNVEAYIAYLKTAMREEPDKMMVEVINESEIRSRQSGWTDRISFLWLYAGWL